MQTSYTWNFAISQGLLQQISRHIETYQDLLVQYITICPAWSKAATNNHSGQRNICFIASPMPKNTPFYPPKSGVFKKPTMTLWVVQFMTLQQPIKEALKMTWTLWDTFTKKETCFFLHESWTTWVKHQGLQPNPWPKCRGWESSPTLKNTPMMRALRPHIGQGWWGAPHSG